MSLVAMEIFYQNVVDTLKNPKERRGIFMGELNSNVRSTIPDDHHSDVVGKYGLEHLNERGELWL